jgi:hypothetical protein
MLSILAVFDGTSFISALGVSETCGIPPLIVSFLFLTLYLLVNYH